MANALSKFLNIVLPKRGNPKGTASTPTYNASNANSVLSLPTYRDHLTDIFDSRQAYDSRTLLKSLFVNDPDMSAAVNAFLTVANTAPIMLVKDVNDQIDNAGQELLNQILMFMTTRVDYSKGFKVVPSLNSITEAMRYMLLLRGGVGAELVVSKEFIPAEIRQVDMATIEWFEKTPGQFTPQQRSATGQIINLDIPSFFVSWFRRDPTSIYSTSPFVSAINTIACRQQVINDLYRIMKITGFPRMEVTVMEEVLMKNAPAEAKITPEARQTYINTQLSVINNAIASIRPEQAFVHLDSVSTGTVNDSKPAAALNIDSVINTLNSQNQAALRTMATIIGRGESGVNTATVEARVFSMNAEELNKPIADLLSQILTMAIRLQGSQSYVHVDFETVELRPKTELEAQLTLRATRLKADLSLGIITDEEYHMKMYGRLPPVGAPKLSGTGFQDSGTNVNAEDVTPNSDPLGRSLSPEGGTKVVKDNKQKKPTMMPVKKPQK